MSILAQYYIIINNIQNRNYLLFIEIKNRCLANANRIGGCTEIEKEKIY